VRDVRESLKIFFDKSLMGQAPQNCPVLLSERQRHVVNAAQQLLHEAKQALIDGAFPESVASLLVSARHELSELLGVYNVDAVYEKIFSSFCIGK
jgi:tRNA U34 5-carboxymethylaminomethyl modifying GTPase MnmE/TrmE